MHDLTKEAVITLLTEEKGGPKVTIYAPMHTTASPPHMTENQIRLKNLVNQAAWQLREGHGHTGKRMADQLTKELEGYLTNLAFWESQTEGLLLCASPANVATFHLPIDTEEYVAVDSCYHLAPVLALEGEQQAFYVLALAQRDPKLYAGSTYGLCEAAAGLPGSLEEALGIDERNQQSEHTQAKGEDVSFNGRGGGRDPKQAERVRFLRIIDDAVCAATERTVPLILAGTSSETAAYRQMSRHANILEPTIHGSFGGAKPHELFKPAYGIIYDQLVATRRQEAAAAYDRLQGTQRQRVTDDPQAIAEAAAQGRIETLLVALRRTTADTVRDTVQAVERLTFPRAELSGLINSAANAVVAASGRVVNLGTELPAAERSPVKAVLRY